ncbi:precorrin-3B synthase [Actinoplanes octamycinicus]|uniref:Precorrin-3B synthase n=1 Tax=Actinoplanes octamycinicus TaxID=135948 RepID=A0A7W7GQW9_9ACTN|nr:precorrin-3B synthase [Actinoplanes octamycinicus]MBB4736648.1 precorrin-3B synthase [Actinoplanes octamycinicus]GIE63146.1 precorrin-3B synthase [Actinoplanes octamycinicus]
MTAHRQSDTDACPGALRLHAAADGLLARVRLPGGLLTGAQLGSLGELAEQFGDGRLELTSRANLQLRALQEGDTARLADRLRAAGLLPSPTHDAVRNIAAPPLAAARLRALVEELDAAIRADPELAGLPGKFLFAIGQVPLAADVAAIPDGPRFGLRFGGHDTGLRVDAGRVTEALIVSAHAFLAEREAQRGGRAAAWRLRELADGPARVSARAAAALRLTPVSVPVATPAEVVDPGALVGVVTDNDQAAAGALVPLGRLESAQIRVLAEAERLVVTPWRGVLVPGLTGSAAAAWIERLAAAGLVVTPTSRWTGVTACAGRPGCARSLGDVRADAEAASRFVEGLPAHWVGCARACGSPAGDHVRIEATGEGYAVTRRSGDGRPAGEAVPHGEAGPGVAPAGDPGPRRDEAAGPRSAKRRDEAAGPRPAKRRDEDGPSSARQRDEADDPGAVRGPGRAGTFPVDVLGDVVAGARRA